MVRKRDHVRASSGSQNILTYHAWIPSHVHASHFWLNEGWTTYMERVLQQILHGPAERSFSYVIGNKALLDDLERYVERPKYQRLVIDFEPGEDPDEAYSSVPYEKGANLLLHLGMSPPSHSRANSVALIRGFRANYWRLGCIPPIHPRLRRNVQRKEHCYSTMEGSLVRIFPKTRW